MSRSAEISDELWAVLEPVLPPTRSGKRGRPAADHRACLEAIAWRYRTGAPWRDLPADLGKWQTAWKRHRRWSGDGTYAELFAEVQRHYGVAGDPDGLVEQLLSIDSTSVRAHQHAAGAPSGAPRGLPDRIRLPAAGVKRGTIELQESAADRAG